MAKYTIDSIPHNNAEAAAEYVDQVFSEGGSLNDAVVQILFQYQHDKKHLAKLVRALNKVLRKHGQEEFDEEEFPEE